MSTFDGHVIEFPDIQIDYFRRDPRRLARAFFLSHVHSDHLQGLESFKGTFIYCSVATREILLQMEKYPHRMNFAKGILESRVQSYKHLASLLKPIPLESPTTIELCPGRSVRVTLFDANHCVGAVMLLIEGDGKAILYTGDIRSEAWWVNSLVRNPVLLPFIVAENGESLRRLDNVYLDTTFATMKQNHRDFPSKASGILELLGKISMYPRETRFYIDSWTFGYEEVWQAVSNFLDSSIHVDEYRYKLYFALSNAPGTHGKPREASQLIGSYCGNSYQERCLTRQQSRLHACEQGTACDIWTQEFVRITPIVSRHKGVDVIELGAGRGTGDLKHHHVLELGDPLVVQNLRSLCFSSLSSDPNVLGRVLELLAQAAETRSKSLPLDDADLNRDLSQANDADLWDAEAIPLTHIVPALVRLASKTIPTCISSTGSPIGTETLPSQIKFPYSRHSSYSELCLLLDAFRPRDIYPCVVRPQWDSSYSMSNLFGHLYDPGHVFRHDQMMQQSYPKKRPRSCSGDGQTRVESCSPERSSSWQTLDELPGPRREWRNADVQKPKTSKSLTGGQVHLPPSSGRSRDAEVCARMCHENGLQRFPEFERTSVAKPIGPGKERDDGISHTETVRRRRAWRQYAFDSALGDGSTWFDVKLLSVHGSQSEDVEL